MSSEWPDLESSTCPLPSRVFLYLGKALDTYLLHPKNTLDIRPGNFVKVNCNSLNAIAHDRFITQ